MKLLILKTVFTLCLFTVANGINFKSERDIADNIYKYMKNQQTQNETEEFTKFMKIASFPSLIYRQSLNEFQKGRQSMTCLTCRSVLTSLIKMYNEGSTMEELVDVMTELCTLFGIQRNHVCRGVIELNAPIFVYIAENQPLLTPEAFCGVVFQTDDKNSCSFTDPRYEWQIDIPEKKTLIKQNTMIKDDATFKVAHISDIHYDPAYSEGSLAECDEPTCCRIGQKYKGSKYLRDIEDNFIHEDRLHVDENGLIYIDIDYADEMKSVQYEVEEDGKLAGFWGDYRHCDIPWHSYVEAVNHIAENHDIDYVYYTGDTIDHGVWETSYEMITLSINSTLEKLKTTFEDIPIYVAIGNHESQPLNQYAPPSVIDPEVSTAWLYDLLADKLSIWLPSDTKDTIKIGGYYTVLVKPGFRIIVLNSNICYVNNWWIHLEPKDPSGQLQWLVDTLLKAEEAEEKVHILSHIPSGKTSVYSTCSREYKRIIERFSDTIIATFNGHTHKDEFQVYYSKNDNTKPLHVGWNGGSLTTYSSVNPNYRILDIDSDSLNVLDIHTWIYNLTDANTRPDQRPNWYKEYSFKEFYGVESLDPVGMDALLNKMVTTDKELLSKHYHIFRGKSADSWQNGCNANCVKKNICVITMTELYDDAKCQELWEKFNQP